MGRQGRRVEGSAAMTLDLEAIRSQFPALDETDNIFGPRLRQAT
jgi:hypothetical protein